MGRIRSGRDDSGGDPGAADADGDVSLEAGAGAVGAEDDLDAEVHRGTGTFWRCLRFTACRS